MVVARLKKPVAVHKLEGTYNATRHGNSAEPLIASHVEVPKEILTPPDSITDTAVRDYYEHHLRFLARLNLLHYSDIPEIIIMYKALQEYRKVSDELQTVDMMADTAKYGFLSTQVLKFGKRFSDLAVKYCISPTVRAKLTLENLQISKEIAGQRSITAKLIGDKKA
jgi:phage terminase small subunit